MLSLNDESTTIQPEPRYQLRSNTQSFEPISFKFTVFTMVPSSVYSTTVIQYNSYQEFKFRLHYINSTSESIWRGSLMVYAYCRTYFHTITVYSIASCDLNTHIHHEG